MRSFLDDIDDHLRSARTGGYHDGKYNRGYDDGLDYAIAVLDMLTVRCKDCKHYQFSDNRAFGFPVKRCEITGFEDVDDDDFCSRAERREDV